jgi:hypothetical protein
MIKVHFQHLKLALTFTLVAGAFFVTYYAHAQESTTTTTESTSTRPANPRPGERQATLETRTEEMSERREEIEATRTEQIEQRQASTTARQEQRAEVRADRQAALGEIRQQRVLNLSANISNRMDAAIARIFSVIERLESRILKMKEAGLDTAAAETKLREAAEHIASARALISNIDALVYNATTSEQPHTNWQGVRATYQEAARLIRASHQSLRETIALLKSSVPRPTTSSSTPETTE